jgi:membrane-associated phospholipid phosphatase
VCVPATNRVFEAEHAESRGHRASFARLKVLLAQSLRADRATQLTSSNARIGRVGNTTHPLTAYSIVGAFLAPARAVSSSSSNLSSKVRSLPMLAAVLVSLGVSWSRPALAAPPLPHPVEPPPARLSFVADPVADGAVLSLGSGTAFFSEAILDTGEITPQQPQDPMRLLSIDRPVIGQTPRPVWGTISSVGLYSAIGFAALDPIATGFRNNAEAGLVDGVIYGETITLTWSMTNLAKIAFRRPRPTAYREKARLEALYGANAPTPDLTQTNSALSFYSGHASITSAVAATATYLAFSRSPHTVRPWITLAVGALTTALVDVGRVRAGEHFPTDVLAGTTAGIGIGVLVPHLHRAEDVTRRPIWIGMQPEPGGSSLMLSGLF